MAVEGALRVTPAATGPPAGLRDSQRPVAYRGNSLPASNRVPRPFWEEEVRRSGAALTEARPSELEDRQVVGPSLSENTEDSDLAKAPGSKSSFPAIGKRKQTGLKNRRDGLVHSRMNRDLNLHGVASFGEEVYRSKDSSVVKPVSKRPEQGPRGKSVEVTHRSRQAGQPTRAGATTPPFPVTSDGTASPPVRSATKPGDHPSAPEDNRSSTSTIATPFETVAPEPDVFRLKGIESREKRITPPVHEPVAGIEDGEEAVPSDLPAAGNTGDAGRGAVEPSSPATAVATASDDDIPVHHPVEAFFPDARAPDSFQADPREGPMSPAATRPPMHEPDSHKVHIGLLEVIVLTTENAPGRKRTKSLEGQNVASRHYLRNF
jgi:hypothetical protein